MKDVVKELIINCPYSGKKVKIAPLLYTFRLFDGPKELADSLVLLMEEVIVFSNDELSSVLSENDNWLFYILTSLRRALLCTDPAKYTEEDLRMIFGK